MKTLVIVHVMVADRRLVYTGNVTEPDHGVFDRALDETARLTGVPLTGGRFVAERVFGLLVSAAGLRVEGWNGSVARRTAFYEERGFWNKLARFFWRRYVDGEVKVKICRIQIRHRIMKV